MSRPLRLIPVDRFEGDIVAEDNDYLYRVTNSQNFDRIPKSDLSSSTQLAAGSAFPGGAPVAGAFVLLSTGTFITQGVDASNTVVRSTDGGVTWNTVTTMDSAVLRERGITKVDLVDGSEAVILGGYEVLSTGEDVELIMLTNDGATVTVLNTWAVDNALVRHIHGSRQDPFTKKLWIFMGDTNAQSGILIVDHDKIDDTTAWSNIGDSALSSITEPGFTVIADGTQKFRPTDMAFTKKYAYMSSDGSPTGIYQGIIRIDKATNRGVYVDRKMQDFSDHHEGFWSLPVTTNQVVHVPLISTGPTDNWEVPFFSHVDDGITYKIGKGHLDGSATKFVPRVFWKGQEDKIYFSTGDMAGSNDQKYTIVMKVTSDPFYGPQPDNFFPCYFVSTTGATSAGTTVGIDPRNPAAMEAVLNRGNGCGIYSTGAVFLFAEGDYTTSTNLSVGDYSNGTFTYQGNAGERIQLRPSGNVTITGTGASYLWNMAGAVDVNLLFSDFNRVAMDSNQDRLFLGSSARNSSIIVQDALFGDPLVDTRRCFEPKNELIQCYRTTIKWQNDGGNNEVLRVGEASPTNQCKIEMYDSLVEGGMISVQQLNDGEFESYNTVFKEYGDTGHKLESGATNTPIYENSVSYSSVAGTQPFDDNAGADYTGRINNCIFDTESSSDGVADSEYDSETVVDPEVGTAGHIFVDPANDDYRPVAGSTAHQRGTIVQDISLPSKNGRPRLSPPSIGPDEYTSDEIAMTISADGVIS